MTNAETGNEDALLELLRFAEEPLSLAKIRAALPADMLADEAELSECLERLATLGRVFRYSSYRGEGTRYWNHPVDYYAQQVILAELAPAPLTAAALDKKVAARLADCPAMRRREILERLLAEGEVYQLPPQPGERAALFRSGAPDLRSYFGPLVAEFVSRVDGVAAKLAGLNVTAHACHEIIDQLLAEAFGTVTEGPGEAREPDTSTTVDEVPKNLQDVILERLAAATKSARHGGLVSLRELRQSLATVEPDKEPFDAVILGLAQEGKVWLYRHDYAASLSDQERAALVCDNKGNFYNGVSLRI